MANKSGQQPDIKLLNMNSPSTEITLNPWAEMFTCMLALTTFSIGVCIAEGIALSISILIVALPSVGLILLVHRWNTANDGIRNANKVPVNYVSKRVVLLLSICTIAMVFSPILRINFDVDTYAIDKIIKEANDLQLRIEKERSEIENIKRLIIDRYDATNTESK